MAKVSPQVQEARNLIDYINHNPDKTLAEVASHFGKTEIQVYSDCGLYMALPELQKAYDRGEFNLRTLYIFSILDEATQREMCPRLREMDFPTWVPTAFARNAEILAAKAASKPKRVYRQRPNPQQGERVDSR